MTEPSWSREEAEDDRTLEENWLFQLRRERFRSRWSGKAHDYYVLHLADAVNVVALTPDRKLVLVRQFRAGSRRDSLETPGGLLEPGEDPCAAGARELVEETGYAGDPPILLGTVWSNPSLLSSRSATVLIANVRPAAEPKLDHGEEVLVESVPARAIPRMIRDGQIDHALTVAGLLWWLARELPESPLAPADQRSTWPRFQIATLMYLVAACAVVSAVWSRLGFQQVLALALALAFPAAAVITVFILDPPNQAILLRPTREAPRRSILRLLAILGLSLMLGIAVIILAVHR